jgi:Holliday junction resolvase
MGNKNYIRGRSKEYEVMDIMRKQGYSVRRSAGNHSDVDVIADGFNETIYIQVKYGSDKYNITEEDLREFSLLKCCPMIRKQVWKFTKGIGKPEIMEVQKWIRY